MHKLDRQSISGISPIINDADNDVARIGIDGDLVETIEGEKRPDNASTIYTIGDDINLFDKNTQVIGELIQTDGKIVTNPNWTHSDYIKVYNNELISVFFDKLSNGQIAIIEFDANKKIVTGNSYDFRNTAADNKYTITTSNSTSYVVAEYRNDLSMGDMKVCKGITTSWSEYNCGSASLKIQNENLAKLEIEAGYRSYNTGNVMLNANFSSYIATVKPNTTYYASYAHSNLCYFDKDMNYIKGNTFVDGGLFDTNDIDNVAYVTVAVAKENKDKIQIQETQNIIISLNEELPKIGDIKNKLFYNEKLKKYQIEKRIDKIVLDGTQNVNYLIKGNTISRFDIISNKGKNIKTAKGICNKLPFDNSMSYEHENVSVVKGYPTIFFIFIKNERLTELTSNGIKEFLKNNPITIYYVLETPEYIDIPQSSQNILNSFLTYKGYNILSSTNKNGLEPIMTLNYQPYFSDEIKKAFRTEITRGYLVVTSTGFIINEENYLKDIKVEELRFVPDKGIFGGTVAKRATINFNNVDNSFTIENEDIEVHIGVEYNNKVYYINYGNFIVQHPENENTTDNTSFEALDYMIKLNGKFKDRLKYPCEMLDIALDICEQAGIELGNYNFRNNHFIVTDNQFVSGETNRIVASAIAYSAFSWARIGYDNKLYFDFEIQNNTTEEIDYDNYYNLNFNDKPYGPINRVILRNSQIEGENVTLDDDESIALNGIHELVIEDNPFAYTQEKREKIIQAASAIFGFYYMPINSVNLTGYIYLDCKDLIGFTDMQQNRIVAYPFNHTITYDGVVLDEIQSPAMTETETKYIYKPELTEAYKNTQIMVNKHDQTIIGLIKKTDDTNDRLTEMLQNLDGFKFSVSNSGGNNLIRNSVGWAELDFWEIDNEEFFNTQIEQGSFYTHGYPNAGQNVDSSTKIRTKDYIILEPGKYKITYKGNVNEHYIIQYNMNNVTIANLVTWGQGISGSNFIITEKSKIRIAFRNSSGGNVNPTSISDISIKRVNDIITNKSDEIVKNSLSKSAFQLNTGIIRQSFEVEIGKTYSIGFKIKKQTVGTGYVKIIGDTLLKEFNFENAKEYKYNSFNYSFKANTQIITIEIYSDCGMIITDLITNTGDILSQWQPYSQELYALGVQIDSNGVKTYDNVSSQEVHLTPTGLSGYYQKNEVFKLNKDITETKKFSAKDEINMQPIKIIKVDNGWDIVYID